MLSEKSQQDINTLFYAYSPNGDKSPVEQAKKDLVAAKVLKNIGPAELNCHVLANPAEFIAACKNDPAKSLRTAGVCVVEVIPKDQLAMFRKAFFDALLSFPEYRRDKGEPVYVMGGNAALGNPASFHNLASRSIRQLAAKKAKEILAKIAAEQPDSNIKWQGMQMLYDRMLHRLAGDKPPAETWHRDEMSSSQIDRFDIIFGGWVNLDEKSQKFSFIPGSHLGMYVADLDGGFASVESFCKARSFDKEQTKKTVDSLDAFSIVVEIPPGHMIMFPQHIMHEIVAQARDYTMIRQFTGWRLTRLNTSIYMDQTALGKRKCSDKGGKGGKAYYDLDIPEGTDKLDQIIETQSIAQLPGSMMPPMYAANHPRFFKERTLQWSRDTFIPQLIDQKTGFVKRYIPSLKELGLPLYPEYTAEEKALYRTCAF